MFVSCLSFLMSWYFLLVFDLHMRILVLRAPETQLWCSEGGQQHIKQQHKVRAFGGTVGARARRGKHRGQAGRIERTERSKRASERQEDAKAKGKHKKLHRLRNRIYSVFNAHHLLVRFFRHVLFVFCSFSLLSIDYITLRLIILRLHKIGPLSLVILFCHRMPL